MKDKNAHVQVAHGLLRYDFYFLFFRRDFFFSTHDFYFLINLGDYIFWLFATFLFQLDIIF